MTLSLLSTWPLLAPPSDPPELHVKLWDLEFSNPIGLAAGMDKDAVAVGAWQGLGFGFAELGTVTPRPQPGNPRPRVFRLPNDRALINRLGFPSDGMDAVARRIERMRQRGVALRLAINLGPNKETAAERVAEDYAALIRRMSALADFIVVNVSSPNTPGLRNWQSPERMREIFAAINGAITNSARRPPILLKVAPDLEAADLRGICDTALELRARRNRRDQHDSCARCRRGHLHACGRPKRRAVARPRARIHSRDLPAQRRTPQDHRRRRSLERRRRVGAYSRRRESRRAVHRAYLSGPRCRRGNQTWPDGLAPARGISLY